MNLLIKSNLILFPFTSPYSILRLQTLQVSGGKGEETRRKTKGQAVEEEEMINLPENNCLPASGTQSTFNFLINNNRTTTFINILTNDYLKTFMHI